MLHNICCRVEIMSGDSIDIYGNIRACSTRHAGILTWRTSDMEYHIIPEIIQLKKATYLVNAKTNKSFN